MKKVTVSKEVAEAIEYAKGVHRSPTNLMDDVFNCGGSGDEKLVLIANHFGGDELGLMRALVNGYEIEKSPKEKLREYYDDLYVDASNEDPGTRLDVLEAKMAGVVDTLDILGITIEGINVERP